MCKRSVPDSKPTRPWRREARWLRPRSGRDDCLKWHQAHGKTYCLACKVWGKRKRNSPQYPQMVMVFPVLPNRWTAQTRTLLARTMYATTLVNLLPLTMTSCKMQACPSWCWKHYGASSALVCHGSFSILIAWCSSQTPRRSNVVSPRLKALTAGMECKGLRVNMKKTKFMVNGADLDVLQKSDNYPCAVCCKGVGNDSIECSQCKLLVHKKCSGIIGRLVNVRNYICPRCKGESRPIYGIPMSQVDIEGTVLDVEDTFFYLGDMLCSGGGCDSAIVARCCVAWGKIKKMLPVLTPRHISPKVRGKVYAAWVHSAMLHGRKTWGPNILDLKRLCHNDRVMIRWICGTTDRVETSSVSLLQKLGIKDITSVLHSGWLRWYGHVQRAASCAVTDLLLLVPRGKGRPRKTWSECVKTNISDCGLAGVDPQDRNAWRASVRRSLLLPTPLNGTRTAP